jgi:hypothetical protein
MNLPLKTPAPANRALYDEIARSHPSLLRGKVTCLKCSRSRVVDPAHCLQHGWPKCRCGAGTMSIENTTEGRP